MSYLRYLCLLVHSGVQHILCCILTMSSNLVHGEVYSIQHYVIKFASDL
jgi:hypothetical protein